MPDITCEPDYPIPRLPPDPKADAEPRRYAPLDPPKLGTDPPEHIAQFFGYSHLPEHLQAVSKPFWELAGQIINTLPRNPERTVALRKLLESKDAAVRAMLAK